MQVPEELASYGQKQEWVSNLPIYMVILHRLARQGHADRYSQTKRFLQFDADRHSLIFNKWMGLANAERVTIIYVDKEVL